MELLTWIPLMVASLVLVAAYVLPETRPTAGRHYSKADRRRYSR